MGLPCPSAVSSLSRCWPQRGRQPPWGRGAAALAQVFRPPREGGNGRAAGGGFSAGPTLRRARRGGLRGHGAPARSFARPVGRLLRAHGGGQTLGADLGSGVRADGERRGVGGGRLGGGLAAGRRGLRPRPLPRCLAGPRPSLAARAPRTRLSSGRTALELGGAPGQLLRRGPLPGEFLRVHWIFPGRGRSHSLPFGHFWPRANLEPMRNTLGPLGRERDRAPFAPSFLCLSSWGCS